MRTLCAVVCTIFRMRHVLWCTTTFMLASVTYEIKMFVCVAISAGCCGTAQLSYGM